jgi:adenylate kinase family enzyme
MSRIAIIGNAGGGKSTLARKIAERRRLPISRSTACFGGRAGSW